MLWVEWNYQNLSEELEKFKYRFYKKKSVSLRQWQEYNFTSRPYQKSDLSFTWLRKIVNSFINKTLNYVSQDRLTYVN